MKWIILNGSPKNENSATVQSIKYLENTNKGHTFEYIHIIKEVRTFEREEEKLIELCKKIENADIVLWTFPLYHLLVHSEYKRFVELINERHLQEYFKNQYTAAFSTSIHFYDHTAHNYIHGICDDFAMNFVGNLSHDMNDLTKEDKRKELQQFFTSVVYAKQENIQTPKEYKAVSQNTFEYISENKEIQVETTKSVAIITDAKTSDSNLNQMIHKFERSIGGKVYIENINEISGNGYCLGCCKCAFENKCVYHDKDDYRKKMDNIINNYDVIIFAGTIKDRYLSAKFKWFFDRSFCYTHIPIYSGKQMGFMISGALTEVDNLKQILEAYSQMDATLIGFISDESRDSESLDKLIEDFAKRAVFNSENNIRKSANFLGVGGRKIFRDDIAGSLGGIFNGDYQYYKKNGLFDFPTKKEKIQSGLMRYLMKRKRFRSEVEKNMIHHMISGHKKVLKKVEEGTCL